MDCLVRREPGNRLPYNRRRLVARLQSGGIATGNDSRHGHYKDEVRELVTECRKELNTFFVLRYMQFSLRMGVSSSDASCAYPSTTEQGLLLLYSLDGGLSWSSMASFNYYGYRSVKSYQAKLPSNARTAWTRFAWWQPLNSGKGKSGWAIDNVYIGGSDTNPDVLMDTFDPITESNWVFYQSASVSGYCRSDGHALAFRYAREKSF